MKYIIEWQDQFKKYHKFQEKTNEADARRVMTRKAADGRRYKLTDEKGNLLDLIG